MAPRLDIPPEQRLVVAADFRPKDFGGDPSKVYDRVVDLAGELEGTGVAIKVNSLLRAIGYGLLENIADEGLLPFADLKLSDIGNTLETDAEFLSVVEAESMLVTAMCSTGPSALTKLRRALPERIHLLGVTVLTSMDDAECQQVYGVDVATGVRNFAEIAIQSELGDLVCSAADLERLRDIQFPAGFSRNTPAIRPAWVEVKGDDQNQKRTLTIAEALAAGADRVIIGRPITQSDDPRGAVMRCLEEIHAALAA